jgi:hypothetical protein
MSKVFLGGTCNESIWREILIDMLEIDYFNPVVDDWNEEAQKRELYEREHCDFVLYFITPKMTGVYAIAEVVDDSNKRPSKTIFGYIPCDEGILFTKGQLKSIRAVAELIECNGGRVFRDLEQCAIFLNDESERDKI